jgi:hypothetical protein
MTALSYPIESSLVYWWDSIAAHWHQVSWHDWAASAGVSGRAKPLPMVRPGDTHFVVCVHDDDGSIANIIPHRYTIDADGFRRRGDDGITDEETAFESAYYLKKDTTDDEDCRHREINEKVYRWSLPPAKIARELLRALPSPPSIVPTHGVRHFMSACGIALHSTHLQ